jgi:lambda family phage tail tape measure protein
MSILARLGVKLALDSSEFKAGLEDATKNTKQFEANQKKAFKNAQNAASELGATMGKVGLGVGLAMAGLYKIFEKADAISDMADAFDTSIGAIVGMGKALEMSGGKAENLGIMLTKLAVNTQEARDGSDKLRDAFKQVGLTAAEVQKLNPEQLMQRVAEQLGAIEDPILRNAKAVELLGKSAKGIDWEKYTDQYKKIADPDLAMALKDAGDAWDNIQKGVSNTYYFMVKLIQPLTAIVNYLTTLKDQYQEFKDQGGTINFDPNNPMGEGTEFKGSGAPKKPKEAPKPILEGTKYDKLSEKEKTIADKEKTMLEMAKLISVEYERQQKFALQQLDTRIKMAGMTENERKVQETVNQVLDATSRKIDDITKRREEAAGRDATQKVLDEYDRQIAKVQELSDAFVKAAKAKEEASIAEQRTFEYGWNKSFAQYAEDAGNYGKLASDMFNSFTGNMNSAIDKFVETGKFAFGDFAKSVIQDLIKIQLRMMMMRAITGIGGLFTMGTAGGFVNEAGGAELAGSLGFADGGEPPVGVASLVGERGPELFIPKTAGTIIPNHQLSSALGNGQPNITYAGPYIAQMNAMDTQSATQFIAKNKMAIWSANQSASRSIPVSR